MEWNSEWVRGLIVDFVISVNLCQWYHHNHRIWLIQEKVTDICWPPVAVAADSHKEIVSSDVRRMLTPNPRKRIDRVG